MKELYTSLMRFSPHREDCQEVVSWNRRTSNIFVRSSTICLKRRSTREIPRWRTSPTATSSSLILPTGRPPDRAFTLRIRDRERRLIRKIQAAIQRLDEGTYGICEDCGEDISIPRLKARPVTKLCINCKARQEEGENIRGE